MSSFQDTTAADTAIWHGSAKIGLQSSYFYRSGKTPQPHEVLSLRLSTRPSSIRTCIQRPPAGTVGTHHPNLKVHPKNIVLVCPLSRLRRNGTSPSARNELTEMIWCDCRSSKSVVDREILPLLHRRDTGFSHVKFVRQNARRTDAKGALRRSPIRLIPKSTLLETPPASTQPRSRGIVGFCWSGGRQLAACVHAVVQLLSSWR